MSYIVGMETKLTVGSLFAGIGGFDLGLERSGGFEIKWQVEIDEYCRRVLEKHWPHVKRYGDIREVADVERVDVLCGGFPCQDISNAGKREGITGERSGLWSEFDRLIRLVRPRIVIVENVSALLNRGMDVVLGDLSESGYDAEWDVIPASAVGAPHRRERVWIVAYAKSGGFSMCGSAPWSTRLAPFRSEDVAHAEEFAVRTGFRTNESGWERGRRSSDSGSEVPHSVFTGLEGHERSVVALQDYRRHNADPAGSGWWAAEPNVGRVVDGIPARVDRLKGLGNAVVPQIVEWIGKRILDRWSTTAGQQKDAF